MKVLIRNEKMNQNIHITKRATKYVTLKLQARKEKQKTTNFHPWERKSNIRGSEQNKWLV